MKSSQHNILPKGMPFYGRRLSLLSGIFITVLLGFYTPITIAQGVDWYWATASYGGIYNGSESIALDPSGNSYVTGYYSHAESIDPFYLDYTYDVSLLGFGAFVAKYNGAGVCIWARQLGDTSTLGTSIAIDDGGNIYSTGIFQGTRDFDPGSGTFNLTSAGGTDIYISKLNSSGDFVWAKSIGGPLADGNFRSCLSVNPDNGEVYLTGYFKGTADFDPGSGTFNLTSVGGDDIFISSLDASGNFLWADRIGGSGSDIAKSISRDDEGHVVTTGKFTGTVDFNPGGGTFNLSGGGTFISKLDGDGGFVFAKKIGNDTGNAITVDASNNIYTTGPFTGTADFDPGVGEFNLTADGTDFFISKLDESGNFIWAVGLSGSGHAEANSIAVDGSGNVFTTGLFVSAAEVDPGPNEYWIGGDGIEVFILKLDASGNFDFAESAGGEDDMNGDIGNTIAIDNVGTAVITGTYDWGYFYIGPFTLDFNGFGYGNTYMFTAKFGTEGTAPLGVSITSSTNVLCHGQSTGSATAAISGGFPPYTYDWSNGQSSAEITDLAAGPYYVTVTDNNGSTAIAGVVITQPPLLEFEPPMIEDVSCNNEGNGWILADVTGGVSPYSYVWSNGETGPYVIDLVAGNYTVTVTDDNNCTQSESYQVQQPEELEINQVNLNNETCVASNDGEITISIVGGTNPATAVWSNGNTGTTVSNLAAGAYSVTITDNNDCTQTADYTILAGIPVETNLVLIHHVSCAGGTDGSVSVTGSSGIPPYVYLWSNGKTGSSIDELPSGSYSVTTTDDYGCSGTGTYQVNEPTAINTQIIESSQIQCAGDSTAGLSAMASGGTAPLAALWSNGIMGFENINLVAGIYSVTITDANACISMMSDTITEPLSISVNAMGTNETGSGANDGTAMSTPTGGVPAFSFLWTNGDTLSAISGLSPGTYIVTTTDANGCTAEGTAIVNAYGCALDIMAGADFNICEDDTIAIQPLVMGGSGTLSYLWSDGSTGESLSVNQGGEYCVTVTDEANCQDLDCIAINEIVIPPLTCPATDESAPGANDGSIQCDSLPGIISYLWSNDSTTSSIEGLFPGQYCVTITEQSGCMSTQCFYVQPGNCQMVVNVFITDILCAGDTTGAISLIVDSVATPITYAWSNGDTTATIGNLTPGNYSVTVSDANGCVDLNTFIISEPLPLAVVIDSIAPADDSGSGLIWVTVTGGTPGYRYEWTSPSEKPLNSEDLNNLSVPGYYFFAVIDDNGCVFTLDSIFVDGGVAVDESPAYKSLKVYPVPAKEVLIIDTEKLISEVLILGIDGRVYKHIILPESNRLDIAELAPGWYVLRIFDGHSWYYARMVK